MKPWIKLYRDESGDFGMLPFMVRAVFTELLKFADDEGRITTGAMDHVSALCLRCSVHPKERRGFKSKLTALLDDGCIRFEKGAVVFPAWERFQSDPKAKKGRSKPHSSDTDATLTEHSDDTDGALTERSRDTDTTLTRHSKLVNPPDSLKTGSGDKDKEEELELPPKSPPPNPPRRDGPKSTAEPRAREVTSHEVYDLIRESWPGGRFPGPLCLSATHAHKLGRTIAAEGSETVRDAVAAFVAVVERDGLTVKSPAGLFLSTSASSWIDRRKPRATKTGKARGWAPAASSDAFDDSKSLDEIFGFVAGETPAEVVG